MLSRESGPSSEKRTTPQPTARGVAHPRPLPPDRFGPPAHIPKHRKSNGIEPPSKRNIFQRGGRFSGRSNPCSSQHPQGPVWLTGFESLLSLCRDVAETTAFATAVIQPRRRITLQYCLFFETR